MTYISDRELMARRMAESAAADDEIDALHTARDTEIGRLRSVIDKSVRIKSMAATCGIPGALRQARGLAESGRVFPYLISLAQAHETEPMAMVIRHGIDIHANERIAVAKLLRAIAEIWAHAQTKSVKLRKV